MNLILTYQYRQYRFIRKQLNYIKITFIRYLDYTLLTEKKKTTS